jgi:hypothetical protein
LAGSKQIGVAVEAIAALANLAVNGSLITYGYKIWYIFDGYLHGRRQ